MFPVFFGFKGGKGILSGGTLVWLLNWRIGLIAWGLFAVLWLLTRYVSLGSLCATLSMPVSTYFFCGRSVLYTVLAVLVASLVVWCHACSAMRSEDSNGTPAHRKTTNKRERKSRT